MLESGHARQPVPVIRVGPWCDRCGRRPARDYGICRACELLKRAFGWDPEWEAKVRRWLEGK
jgi:hypothetical protein